MASRVKFKKQRVDTFAKKKITEEVYTSVHSASALKTESRIAALNKDFKDPNSLRKLAGQIKQHTIDHLDHYLTQVESRLKENGAEVHFAADANSANDLILKILNESNAKKVVKSKSMATEETHLNAFLEEKDIEIVETDLGEFIVQLDEDHPSHIVTPIIHKNRDGIAKTFEKHGLGDYNSDPEVITRRARVHLRDKYIEADAAITGGNFISAESGKLVLCTNEGNSRFSLAVPKLHIALVGIEKLVPKDRDLQIFLNLLARSATGQQLTIYTEFIEGPRLKTQPDGPTQMHVILMDNGRSGILGTRFQDILNCIRCGACLNICPVYRQASGHGYRSVYPGPIGSVLTPLLAGENFEEYADLPKACSVCGACNDACPVDIPLPDLLLKLRDKAKIEKVHSPGTPPMKVWSVLASSPVAWKLSVSASNLANKIPLDMIPVPPLSDWMQSRTLPEFRGGSFRRWMKDRQNNR